MKIGIITVHRAHNYGSVLQCYALQEYLKSQGHDVWVIDYRQRWTEAVYSPFSLYYVWHFARRADVHAVVGYWRDRKGRALNLKKSGPIFASFRERLNLTAPCRRHLPQGFDAYVVGSDQLWSCQCVGGEDPIYTGRFRHPAGSTVVGYALSAGTDSLQRFGEEGLRQILSRFDRISLREAENAELTRQLTGQKLPICVDPVLLTDAAIWKTIDNGRWEKENYVAVYQVRYDNIHPRHILDKAQELASQLGCKVVDLSNMSFSVGDFVSVIKHARYVFTTSFHATVFSLLMQTPCFAVRLGDGLDVRYVDLLSKLGMEAELVDKDFTPRPFTVDFDAAKERLEQYRAESVKFLASALQK